MHTKIVLLLQEIGTRPALETAFLWTRLGPAPRCQAALDAVDATRAMLNAQLPTLPDPRAAEIRRLCDGIVERGGMVSTPEPPRLWTLAVEIADVASSLWQGSTVRVEDVQVTTDSIDEHGVEWRATIARSKMIAYYGRSPEEAAEKLLALLKAERTGAWAAVP